MSEIQNQIEETRAGIKQCEELIAQRDEIAKLISYPEFKKFIIEGFCRDEAARHVGLSTDPNLDHDSRADSLGNAQAAGYFKRFINLLIVQGNQAASRKVELEELLEELRAEDTE